MADTVVLIVSVNSNVDTPGTVEVISVALPATLPASETSIRFRSLLDFGLNATQFNTAIRNAAIVAVNAAGFPFSGGDRMTLLGGAL